MHRFTLNILLFGQTSCFLGHTIEEFHNLTYITVYAVLEIAINLKCTYVQFSLSLTITMAAFWIFNPISIWAKYQFYVPWQ